MIKKRHLKPLWLLLGIFLIVLTGCHQTEPAKTQNSSAKETIVKLTEKVSGIYYFSYPECPWCQELTPILEEVVSQQDKKLQRVNTHDSALKESDKNKLKNFIVENSEFDDIVVPLIFVVNAKGEIQYHVGTVEGHDATKAKMTDEQGKELRETLEKMITN